MILRPRQTRAIDEITTAYRAGFRAPILCAPTGFGKSATSSVIIKRALDKGKTVWFVAHLREILADTSAKLTSERIPHGWIAAGVQGNRRLPVQCVMIQTLARRLSLYKPPDLMIVDESHLSVSETYQTVFEWANAGPKFWRDGGTHLLHLTATPQRLDGRGMGEVSDIIIQTCSSQELIDEGLLAPLRYLKPGRPDLSGVHTLGGEYRSDEVSAIMQRPQVVGSAVEHYLKHGRGRPGLGFAVDIASARKMAEAFTAAGLRAMAVSGDSDAIDRDAALTGLKTGSIDFVWNCKLFVAGVDAPAISYISDMRPTKSLTNYLQGLGRGLRVSPGKTDLLYADHAGNFDVHGNPLAAREWSLAGARTSKAEASAMSVRNCPRCFAPVPSLRPVCAICKHVFEIKQRVIEEVAGDLEEITLAGTAPLTRNEEQGKQKTREDLVRLFIARGSSPVNARRRAEHVLAGRARKQARESLRSSIVEGMMQ